MDRSGMVRLRRHAAHNASPFAPPHPAAISRLHTPCWVQLPHRVSVPACISGNATRCVPSSPSTGAIRPSGSTQPTRRSHRTQPVFVEEQSIAAHTSPGLHGAGV